MWMTVALTMLSAVALDPHGRAPETELMSAFRTAEVAEIYIVARDLTAQSGLRPFSVRTFGCRYFIFRWMPQWAELERAMAQASVRIDQVPAYGEMRVGLVFGDRVGTLLEIYSSDFGIPHAREKGYVQRREVGISASFAQTLRSFAEAHRNLATVDQSRQYLCAPEQAR